MERNNPDVTTAIIIFGLAGIGALFLMGRNNAKTAVITSGSNNETSTGVLKLDNGKEIKLYPVGTILFTLKPGKTINDAIMRMSMSDDNFAQVDDRWYSMKTAPIASVSQWIDELHNNSNDIFDDVKAA